MDGTYDEDLSENPFFIEFKNEHPELFQHCISEGWIICIPRIGCLTSHFFVLQDFLGHILVQNEELPETHYSTLTEKPAKVLNKVITLDNEGIPFQCHILFEETFYTEDFHKHRVWCLESMLEPTIMKDGRTPANHQIVNSLRDCIDLLWTESAGQDVLENIEVLVREFLKRNHLDKANLTKQKDLIGALYTNCLQKAFRNKRLKEKSYKCKHMMQNLKLSVETFLQHLMYDNMMNAIRAYTAYEDSYFNKIIRNLSDIQLRDLDVRKDVYDRVPRAKKCLSNLQSCKTILEKVVCIKNTIYTITEKASNNSQVILGENLLTADDLLPVMIFLVIKCGLPNWIAQITYMKEFRYSSSSGIDADETSFLITTLEAVIEHIKSGILTGCSYPESHNYYDDSITDDTPSSTPQRSLQSLTESSRDTDQSLERTTVAYLFEQIRLSNFNEVKAMLEQNMKHPVKEINTPNLKPTVNSLKNKSSYCLTSSLSLDEVLREDDEVPLELCHPLCNCRKCHRIVSKSMLNTTPTVESRDSHGFTPLHIAAINGTTNLVELILRLKANVNVTDYNGYAPLHYAALRGHQNALLLLLHAGAIINLQNNDGNTALHLASNNGHESCVKALVYFSEFSKSILGIDSINERGNTALHLASKWGYEGIVRLLIDYGADPNIPNSKAKTSFHYANNDHILKILKSHQPNLQEYIIINFCPSDQNGNHVEVSSASTSNISNVSIVDKFSILNGVSANTNFEPVRPQTIEEIRSIERLLQAIVYGDSKLACFYMNVNYLSENEEVGNSLKTPKKLCHPLCDCTICSGDDHNTPTNQKLNVNLCNSDGYTPLHIAVKHDRIELCEILLKNGAIANLRNKNNHTPLHIAAQNARYSICELLIKFKAVVNMADIMGNTPLHMACSVGCISIVRLLLDKGAQSNVANVHGKTPLDEAREGIFLTIIGMLERHIALEDT